MIRTRISALAAAAACVTFAGCASAQATRVTATSANVDAVLRAARPGSTVQLVGVFGRVVVRGKSDLSIDARQAQMTSLEIYSSQRVSVTGGVVDSGSLSAWRAAMVRDSSGVSLQGMTFTNSGNGLTVMNSSGTLVSRNLFYGLRSDCIDLAGAPGTTVSENVCRDSRPILAKFDANGKMLQDGDHPDCVQLWPLAGYPNRNIRIVGNTCTGDMQGVFSNGRDGDGTGSDGVIIERNAINNTFWWGIALGNTRNATVRYNQVAAIPGTVRTPGGLVQSRISLDGGNNTVCGNQLADLRGSMPGATKPC